MIIEHSLDTWWADSALAREFGHIHNYCLCNWGIDGSIYDSDKVYQALSKLTFLRKVRATPWAAEDNLFFAINRKKLKKWFKQNHNRFLLKLTPDHKQKIVEYLTN